MTGYPSKGATISIGTTGALSGDAFTEIGEVISIAEFGTEHELIKYRPLKTGTAEKLLGGSDDGDPVLQLAKNLNDAGQIAVKAALGDNDYYNFKIVPNDTDATHSTAGQITFKAKVVSFKTNFGDQSNFVGASVQLAIKSGSITDTAAAA